MKRMMLAVIAGLCVAGTQARAELRAGAAKVDITPDVKAMSVPLGGYAARKGAPATGVHDPIFARALVVENGANKVCMVSLDLCFLPANINLEVVKRLAAAKVRGLDAEHVFLSATHTHSASDPLAMHSGNTFTMLKGWTKFDGKLLDFTVARIAKAIVEADQNLAPAKIGTRVYNAAGLNRNRRGEAAVDADMTLLKVTRLSDGQAIAALVNFAAHPTLYDDKMREISADWPGVMVADVERSEAGVRVCLFLNGAEGDASPNGVDNVAEAEKVAAYGHRLSNVVLAQLIGITPEADFPVRAWTQTVTLPLRKASGGFLLAALQMGASYEQARQLVTAMMPEKTQLGFVRLGKTLWMTFPCEPTGELGLAAKKLARAAGYETPAVVALTNDWLAYALTPEQYKAGKYEAMMSFYGDQLGPTLLASLQEGLAKKP